MSSKTWAIIGTIVNSAFQPPSYFFGTIHVPYTRVWDAVSTNTKKAFHAADKVGIGFEVLKISLDWPAHWPTLLQVYFELDLTNPYTIAALTSCQLLPRGLNLSQVIQCNEGIQIDRLVYNQTLYKTKPSPFSQVLPPDVYSRLRGHLDWVKDQMSGWVTMTIE